MVLFHEWFYWFLLRYAIITALCFRIICIKQPYKKYNENLNLWTPDYKEPSKISVIYKFSSLLFLFHWSWTKWHETWLHMYAWYFLSMSIGNWNWNMKMGTNLYSIHFCKIWKQMQSIFFLKGHRYKFFIQ